MFVTQEDARKGQTFKWMGLDSLTRYIPIGPDNKPNYPIDAFDYKFNPLGFRCDEFDLHSDLPIYLQTFLFDD